MQHGCGGVNAQRAERNDSCRMPAFFLGIVGKEHVVGEIFAEDEIVFRRMCFRGFGFCNGDFHVNRSLYAGICTATFIFKQYKPYQTVCQ